MSNVLRSTIVITVLSAASSLQAQENQTAKIEAATDVADVWLVLVDEGAYDESWDIASAFIQGLLHRNEWGPSIATDTASGKVNEIVALIFETDGWNVMGYHLRQQP